jgi:hypothetical protein
MAFTSEFLGNRGVLSPLAPGCTVLLSEAALQIDFKYLISSSLVSLTGANMRKPWWSFGRSIATPRLGTLTLPFDRRKKNTKTSIACVRLS